MQETIALSAFFVMCLVGTLSITLGAFGYISPCNRYADARVTGCSAGLVLGSSVFNISYEDSDGRSHDGSFESFATPSCLSTSTNQVLVVCYLAKDPGTFVRHDVSFMSGVVVFSDPDGASRALLGGTAMVAAAAALAFCYVRFCGRACIAAAMQAPLLEKPMSKSNV